jgi:glucosamine--fructose-6-phosphate aminotransferase (isomerizing)
MNAEGFWNDVLGEPAALDGMLDAYAGAGSPLRELGPLDGRRVVLTGMGSSRYAALPAAAALRSRGIWAVAELASTGRPTPPGDDVVAIGISASGSTEETVEALARHHGVSRTAAVTNHPDRALAAGADVVLPLLAGEETGGVSCRTFQATVALLHLVAGVAPEALRGAPEAQAALLDSRAAWLDPLLHNLGGAHTVYTIAPDERIASALEAALMFREGPRVPADATETGDWLHVDVYLTKQAGYRALLFPGSRYDAGVMEWARERASTIVVVGEPLVAGAALTIPYPGADDPVTASLVETSVAELAAAEWWRRRLADGTMP